MLWGSLAAWANLKQNMSLFNGQDNPLEPYPFITFLTTYIILAVLALNKIWIVYNNFIFETFTVRTYLLSGTKNINLPIYHV